MLTRHWTIGLVAIVATVGVAEVRADEPEHLCATRPLGEPTVILPSTGDAYLMQTVEVDLQKGANTLRFDFGQLKVGLEKLRLFMPSGRGDVTIADVALSAEAPNTVVWQLGAETACRAALCIASPLKDLTWRYEYRLEIDSEDRTVDIACSVVLTNNSALELDDARIHLPGRRALTKTLRKGESRTASLFEYKSLAYEPLLIYDPERYKSETTAILRLPRDGEGDFSNIALMAGDVRIYAHGGADVYLAKDKLPYVPAREPVEVNLGGAPDITVSRKLVEAKQVPVAEDITGELALFHEDDRVEFEVTNGRQTPVTLHIRDVIDGDWEMLDSSEPFERIDADTVEFVLELAGKEGRKLTYTARRKNLEP